MRGRVASAGDVLIQRFRAVEAAALEKGGWSLARHLELLPEAAVSTVSSGVRGVMIKAERDSLRLRRSLRKRSPRRRPEEEERPLARHHRWRSAVEEEEPRGDRQRIREERRSRRNDPHETSNGGTKPDEGKARAKENEASS